MAWIRICSIIDYPIDVRTSVGVPTHALSQIICYIKCEYVYVRMLSSRQVLIF